MFQSKCCITYHGDSSEQDGVLYRYPENSTCGTYRKMYGREKSP